MKCRSRGERTVFQILPLSVAFSVSQFLVRIYPPRFPLRFILSGLSWGFPHPVVFRSAYALVASSPSVTLVAPMSSPFPLPLGPPAYGLRTLFLVRLDPALGFDVAFSWTTPVASPGEVPPCHAAPRPRHAPATPPPCPRRAAPRARLAWAVAGLENRVLLFLLRRL